MRGDVEFASDSADGIIASLNLLNHLDAFLGELRKKYITRMHDKAGARGVGKIVGIEEWKWYQGVPREKRK